MSKGVRNKNNCKTIVEIGVHRNKYNDSSTGILIDNKNDDCLYLGIDINDKSFLDNKDKNIFTLKTCSSHTSLIVDTLKKLHRNSIDFLFIDGWHSINQVIKELKLLDILSDNGIVAFHDISWHPGPHNVFKAINEDIFEKYEYHCKNDWGIGFIIKK